MTSTRIRILFWRVSPPEMLCLKTGMYTPGEVLRSPVEMVALRKPLFSVGKSPGFFCHWVSVHQIIRLPEYHPQRKIIWKHRYILCSCAPAPSSGLHPIPMLATYVECFVNVWMCVCDSLVYTFNHFHMFAWQAPGVAGGEKSMCLGITLTFVRLGRWKHVGKDWFNFCNPAFVFFWLFHIIFVCHVLFLFCLCFWWEMCTKIKCWCFNFVWSVFFPCKIVFLRKEYVYCMVRMYIWYVCLQTNLWVSKPVSHVEIGQKLRRNGMGFESHGVLWFWSMAICTLW